MESAVAPSSSTFEENKSVISAADKRRQVLSYPFLIPMLFLCWSEFTCNFSYYGCTYAFPLILAKLGDTMTMSPAASIAVQAFWGIPGRGRGSRGVRVASIAVQAFWGIPGRSGRCSRGRGSRVQAFWGIPGRGRGSRGVCIAVQAFWGIPGRGSRGGRVVCLAVQTCSGDSG